MGGWSGPCTYQATHLMEDFDVDVVLASLGLGVLNGIVWLVDTVDDVGLYNGLVPFSVVSRGRAWMLLR